MARITISLDESLARAFDRLIEQRGYHNRSEAVRDLLRHHLEISRQAADESRDCVANVSYVYNHHERELAERLTELQHHHHDLTVATMHAHLDHNNCLESVIPRARRKKSAPSPMRWLPSAACAMATCTWSPLTPIKAATVMAIRLAGSRHPTCI